MRADALRSQRDMQTHAIRAECDEALVAVDSQMRAHLGACVHCSV